MLPVILSVAGAAAKSSVVSKVTGGISGKISGVVSGIFGGAERDEARKTRLMMYESGVHAGSVTAARYMYGQRSQNVNDHEIDWYDFSIGRTASGETKNSQGLEFEFPQLMQRAKALGGLWDDDADVQHGFTLIQNELAGMGVDWDGERATNLAINGGGQLANEVATGINKATNAVREQAASTAQRLGTGATNAATEALAPDGSPLKHPLTIPTNVATVALGALALGGAFLLLRKR